MTDDGPGDRSPGPAGDPALDELLRRLGGTDDELSEAGRTGSAGDLALELVLRAGNQPLSVPEAVASSGLAEADFITLWRALGFVTPEGPRARIPADLVAALPIVSQGITELLGEEVSLGLVRVIGATSARIAEALVDAFRMQFEVPELSAGVSYADVVARYVEITRTSLPALESFISAVLKAHLVRVASGAWAPDEENLATRRNLFVGFIDLVGYTSLSRTLSPGELAALLGRFEETVADVVTGRGGRVVKLIGDGAMYVTDAPEDGCRAALDVSARLAAADDLPPARVGGDCGPVVSLYGDYFGEVVNRAARLVALANPSTVVVSESVAAAGRRSFTFEQLPPQALKGFQAPAVTYRLLER